MNSNETRTLWISVAMSLLAVFLVYSYSQEKKAQYDRRYGTAKRVVTAKQDIAEMQTIDDTLLDITEKPVDFIEPGAVSDPEIIIGQVAATPIKKGEQITESQLLSPGPFTGVSLQVSPGKRALAVPVDEVRGVAKLLQPGDRIDLVAALDYGKGAQMRREVKTILQNVVVLATGLKVVNNIPRLFEKSANGKDVTRVNLNGDTSYTNVTLEVSPEQAQQLIYILSVSPGSLFVTLRNPNDSLIKGEAITTAETVLGKEYKTEIDQSFRQPSSVPPMMAPGGMGGLAPSIAPSEPAQPPGTLPKKGKKKGPFVEL